MPSRPHPLATTRQEQFTTRTRSPNRSKRSRRTRRESYNERDCRYQRHVESTASAVTDKERAFFFEWAIKRNLEKQYVVLAITYWMRVRSKIWTYFLQRPKELYMVVCIHIALKWLGYDEMLKCNFVKDLREIAPTTKEVHQEMEFLILSELGWDLQ